MLDDNMHKSTVSLGGSGGDTKGKEDVIEASMNKPRPTFNMIGVVVLSTVVSIVGIMFSDVVGAFDHGKLTS